MITPRIGAYALHVGAQSLSPGTTCFTISSLLNVDYLHYPEMKFILHSNVWDGNSTRFSLKEYFPFFFLLSGFIV